MLRYASMVCDQLKVIWKCLLYGILLSPLSAELIKDNQGGPLDTVRITEEQGNYVLESLVRQYEKDGVLLDVVGAVHLADLEYFEALNQKFDGYAKVLYEMVGEQKPPKPGTRRSGRTGPVKNQMDVVSKMYSMYTHLLNLSQQSEVIDYHKPHFIHADMTSVEFQSMQSDNNETIMSYAMQSTDLFSEINEAQILSAMLSGNSTALKRSLIKVMAKVDDKTATGSDETVIIGARNDKCLTVLDQQLKRLSKPEEIAIFYGAAHLHNFDLKLKKRGWKVVKDEWMPAWTVPVK